MASQHSSGAEAHRNGRGRTAIALVGALVLLFAGAPARATGGDRLVHPGPPSLSGAGQALADAQAARTEAMARRSSLQAELAATRAEIDQLDDRQAELAEELEDARRQVRVVTVRAYTGGAGAQDLASSMDIDSVADSLWQEELLAGNVVDTHAAIDRYQRLRRRADERVIELAEEADGLVSAIEQAGLDIAQAAEQIERAEVELSAARAVDAQGGGGRSDPGEAAWSRLRFCESGGIYTTDTGNGFYGAYQFDRQTWRSMGGQGNPAHAPYWEQDLRAKGLYQARGAQPWPICGRFVG